MSYSYRHAYEITPADTPLSKPVKAIHVTTQGNLVVRARGDVAANVVVTIPVVAAQVVDLDIDTVYANTTASGLIGKY